MMNQQVVLRVRPGETVRFPTLCVACGQPARERLPLQYRRGQVTRRLDAPLCADCARQLARRSGQEERLLRLSWPAAIVVAVLAAAIAFIAFPLGITWLRLVLAAGVGLGAGAFVRWAFIRRAARTELPEKRAVSEAAQIADFTWRDITLSIARADIADRVRALNVDVLAGEPPTPEGPVSVDETAA
jgi:hypothetical protein